MNATRALALLLAACAMPAAALDLAALWDFDRPELSAQRFRAALPTARGDDALVLRTQIARSHGLRGQFEAAHHELDAIEPLLAAAGPEPRVLAALERGRALRSADDAAGARPHFERALALAESASLEALAIDALHMLALLPAAPDAQLALNRQALARALAAQDPAARTWEASLLNNIGMTLHGQGRLDEALASFCDALAARERQGEPARTRVARWMVAWTLRGLGRDDEALALQQALERELDAAGERDPFVYEELAALHAARGDAAEAARYRALKRAVGSASSP